MAAGSDLSFSSFQPEASIFFSHSPLHPTRPSPQPPPLSPPLSPSFSLPPASQGAGLQSPSSSWLPLRGFSCPRPECVRACVRVRVPVQGARLGARLPLFLLQEPTLAHLPSVCPDRPLCPPGLAVLVSSCISLFSPLSLCPSSDLDRDFWNNNESTVQQKWSSYPPKEFILNISPYAPYGDPRLSLK